MSPWQTVRQLLPRIDIEEPDLDLVLASIADPVRDELAVAADREELGVDRVVVAQRMRVDDHLVLATHSLANVEDPEVVLSALLPAEESPSPLPDVLPDAVDAHELGEAVLDQGEERQSFERRLAVRILLVDPLPGLGTPLILEPAIGIGDRDAMEGIDDDLDPGWRG